MVSVALVVLSAPTSLAATGAKAQPAGFRDAICWWLPIACA
ncbi:hypothetical protein [Raineyella fluvialis]|nr:hypothetical protein [Raineyella fluvialis]